MRSKFVGKAVFCAFQAVCLLFAWIYHLEIKNIKLDLAEDPKMYFVPEARWIKPVLLGHEALLADLVWIRTLGYFADELLSGGKYRYLDRLIDLATDLDPRFEKLYIWAGAVLMYSSGAITEEKIEASTQILKKGWDFIQSDPVGWKHAEDYWLIPQMIGFNYAIELKDRKRGAPYIAAAAQIPGSPELYKTWAATLYKKSGDLEAGAKVLETMLAIEVLKGQLENVEKEDLKNKIRLRLRMYYEQLYGPEQAKVRAEALVSHILDMRRLWQEHFPYLDFELFMTIWNAPTSS